MERPHEVLARLQINADFSADRTVHLRQQGCWNLHEIDAAQKRCSDKPGEIANDAAAERNHKGLPLDTVRGELIVACRGNLQALGSFAARNGDKNGIEARRF
jgi:hypothetical protein